MPFDQMNPAEAQLSALMGSHIPFGQMNPAAAQLPAMMGNTSSIPASGAAANTSEAYAQLYASYIPNMNAQAQSPGAACVPGSQHLSSR